MHMADLMTAYKAIHDLRRIADKHSDEINLSSFPIGSGGTHVNPVALLHDTIQERAYDLWASNGGEPFLWEGKIVWWDYRTNRIAITDAKSAQEFTE